MRLFVRSLACLVAVAALAGLFAVSYTAPPPPVKVVVVTAPPPPAPPPAPAEPPPLPEVQIKDVPIHAVPGDYSPPGMPAAPERGESAEVASGAHAPIPAVPKQFSGIAHVMGAAALQVDKVPVQLYGIREPTPHDRCGVGDAADCVAAAKRALAAHIAGATISCQTPSPKPGIIVAFAVCLDGQGVDLGGFLVAEGLALADTGQTYDYAGAESIARGQKRGLWGFR